ncbi:MAG: type II toxin-antitoxin system RelE/ParE family toxin [Bacteroidetes bacterium]|nr:MAG: type II toxin-antitoxin system RelE/ParE family toxin [Bacteroidota bacterium]
MRLTNFEIKILERAKNDLREARKYYNKCQKGLGQRFLLDTKFTVKSIQNNPRGFEIRYKTVRMAHLSVFPFSIHFEIFENQILILAIIHSHMSSDKWI